MKTLFGLLVRIGKLEQQYTNGDMAGVIEGHGLAALLPLMRRLPRDAEQERADEEILKRYAAGLAEPPVMSGLSRLLFEARLEKRRTRLLEDQAGEGSDAPSAPHPEG